jgi:Spy/CpxP family protein refolding chaperone
MWPVGKSDFGGVGTAERLAKSSWLFYLLVFSLALNLASFGTLAYLRRQEANSAAQPQPVPPLTVRELCRSMPLNAEQCQQLRNLMSEHQKRRRNLRLGLAQEQRDLWEIMKQDFPSLPEIRGKIKEISLWQTKSEEEAVRLCLEIQKHLQPEERVVYLKMLEWQLRPRREGGGDPAAPGAGRHQWGNTRKNPPPGN